jgi:soluble lytic murein transglycosylase-like protein
MTLLALMLPCYSFAEKLEVTSSEALKSCYVFDRKKNEWQMTCAGWSEFTKRIDVKKIATEHRLLYSRLAIQEIIRLRQSILVAPPTPTTRGLGRPILFPDLSSEFGYDDFQRSEITSFFSKIDKKQEFESQGEVEPRIPRSNSLEGDFFQATEPILKMIEAWLKPLENRNNVLLSDALFVRLMAYGEAMRFEKVMGVIKTNWKDISSSTLRQREVYQRFAFWTKSFGAIPLRDWFYDEMIRVRPSKITGRRSIDLFYYLESLRLAQPNLESNVAVDTVLKTLRLLWIVHTSKEERDDIRSLVSTLRLRSRFTPPALASLSAEELLLQAQSHVRRLDGESALSTVSQILADSHKDKVSDAQLWETFQVHVRILRIMDRRPEIPALINRYAERGEYLKLNKSTPNKERSARRVLDIAKLEWTYGSHGRALGLLQRIQTFHKDFPLSKALLADILYVKSRIMEQGKEKDIAEVVISDALATKTLKRDHEYDLRWRLFFMRMNIAYEKKSFKGLESDLSAIEPLIADNFERLRLNFWRGTLALYQGNKEVAKENFAKTYKAEPMSYYGNLSALSLKTLGEEVGGWLKPAEKNVKEPDWTKYVRDNGTYRELAYRNIGRAVMLRRAGFEDWLSESLDDLASQLWSYVPAKKNGPLSKRLAFARATMWLFTELGEPMSALRAADIVVTTLKEESPYDFNFLYPLAYWEDIQKYSAEQKIDPWFTVSLIRQESAFKVNARSWANALGLMQMIPPVAENEARLMGIQNYSNEALLDDPELSIRMGTHHLGGLVRRFEGSWMCVLAGYNAGFPPVMDWLKYYPSPIPLTFIERISYTETRLYVMTIFRNYMNYQRIHGEGKVSLAQLNQIPTNSIPQK